MKRSAQLVPRQSASRQPPMAESRLNPEPFSLLHLPLGGISAASTSTKRFAQLVPRQSAKFAKVSWMIFEISWLTLGMCSAALAGGDSPPQTPVDLDLVSIVLAEVFSPLSQENPRTRRGQSRESKNLLFQGNGWLSG